MEFYLWKVAYQTQLVQMTSETTGAGSVEALGQSKAPGTLREI